MKAKAYSLSSDWSVLVSKTHIGRLPWNSGLPTDLASEKIDAGKGNIVQ